MDSINEMIVTPIRKMSRLIFPHSQPRITYHKGAPSPIRPQSSASAYSNSGTFSSGPTTPEGDKDVYCGFSDSADSSENVSSCLDACDEYEDMGVTSPRLIEKDASDAETEGHEKEERERKKQQDEVDRAMMANLLGEHHANKGEVEAAIEKMTSSDELLEEPENEPLEWDYTGHVTRHTLKTLLPPSTPGKKPQPNLSDVAELCPVDGWGQKTDAELIAAALADLRMECSSREMTRGLRAGGPRDCSPSVFSPSTTTSKGRLPSRIPRSRIAM